MKDMLRSMRWPSASRLITTERTGRCVAGQGNADGVALVVANFRPVGQLQVHDFAAAAAKE